MATEPKVVDSSGLERAILRWLKRKGPTKQGHLFYHVARPFGVRAQLDPEWLSAIERLVQSGQVLRSPLRRRDSFMLRIPPRRVREQQQVQITEPAPLTPEAA